MNLWAFILIPPALFGLLCAYFIKGRTGLFASGIIPWLGLLGYIQYLNYFGPAVEMWQVVQLFGGAAVAGIGVVSYVLFRDLLNKNVKNF